MSVAIPLSVDRTFAGVQGLSGGTVALRCGISGSINPFANHNSGSLVQTCQNSGHGISYVLVKLRLKLTALQPTPPLEWSTYRWEFVGTCNDFREKFCNVPGTRLVPESPEYSY